VRFAVVLALCTAALAGCGSDDGGGGGGGVVTPKLGELEAQIERDASKAVLERVDVDCDDDAEAKAGATFDCAMKADDGTTATATVKVNSVDLERKPPIQADWNAPLVQVAAMVDDMRNTLDAVGEADCPALTELRSLDDLDLTCEVSYTDGTDGRVRVTAAGTRYRFQKLPG
jgi:hypothetical protein